MVICRGAVFLGKGKCVCTDAENGSTGPLNMFKVQTKQQLFPIKAFVPKFLDCVEEEFPLHSSSDWILGGFIWEGSSLVDWSLLFLSILIIAIISIDYNFSLDILQQQFLFFPVILRSMIDHILIMFKIRLKVEFFPKAKDDSRPAILQQVKRCPSSCPRKKLPLWKNSRSDQSGKSCRCGGCSEKVGRGLRWGEGKRWDRQDKKTGVKLLMRFNK